MTDQDQRLPGVPGTGWSSWLTLRAAKRLVILVIGSTVVLLGAVMIVTPGPGLVVIIGGLGILATEFIWARRLLKKVKTTAQATARRFGGWQPMPSEVAQRSTSEASTRAPAPEDGPRQAP